MHTPIASIRLCVNNFSACSERALDMPGYIPFLGSLSAGIRLKLAAAQIVTALVMAILATALYMHKQFINKSFDARIIQECVAGAGENLTSAGGNIVRSLIEGIPVINFLVLFTYDQQKYHMDSTTLATYPKISYPELHKPLIFSSSTPSLRLQESV